MENDFLVEDCYDTLDHDSTWNFTKYIIKRASSNWSRLSNGIIIFNGVKITHCTLILILNAILLYFLITIAIRRRFLGNHFYYVCNFCIADFLVGMEGLFHCLAYVMQDIPKSIQMLHHATYKMLITASLFLFLSHAIVQWRAIRRPLDGHQCGWGLPVSSWLFGISMGVVGSWFKYKTYSDYSRPYIDFKYFELAMYLANTIAISTFYMLVFVMIKKKLGKGTNREMVSSTYRSSIRQPSVYIVRTLSVAGVTKSRWEKDENGLRANWSTNRSPLTTRKVAITSLTVASVHVLCFIPYIAFYIVFFTRDPVNPYVRLAKLYINGVVLTLRSLLLPLIFMRRIPEVYSAIRKLCKRTCSYEIRT